MALLTEQADVIRRATFDAHDTYPSWFKRRGVVSHLGTIGQYARRAGTTQGVKRLDWKRYYALIICNMPSDKPVCILCEDVNISLLETSIVKFSSLAKI